MRQGNAMIASVLAVAGLAGAAQAGLVTNWDFNINTSAGDAYSAQANPGDWTSSLLPNGDTVVEGSYDNGNWFIEYDLVFNNDPLVTANYIITNNNGATLGFNVFTRQGVSSPGTFQMRGSVSGSIGDNTLLPPFGEGDGATLSQDGTAPLYRAIVDGASVRTLGDVFSVTALPNGTETVGPFSFGIPVFEAAPGTNMGMAIRNQFWITADDSVGLNNTFLLVPTPGAVALMAIGGFAAARRRR